MTRDAQLKTALRLLNNKLHKVYFKLNLSSTVDQAQEYNLVELRDQK